MVTALDFWLGSTKEIIIAGNADKPDVKRMLKLIHSKFLPNAVMLLHEPDKSNSALYNTVPFIKNLIAVDGKATAYVCENYVCNEPVNDIVEFEKLIAGKVTKAKTGE